VFVEKVWRKYRAIHKEAQKAENVQKFRLTSLFMGFARIGAESRKFSISVRETSM
jgi:hypothetical protein